MRKYKDPLLTAFDEELEEMDKKAERKQLRELGASTKADGESDQDDDDKTSSEGDSDDDSSSDEEEENVDIKFPNTNAEDLH